MSQTEPQTEVKKTEVKPEVKPDRQTDSGWELLIYPPMVPGQFWSARIYYSRRTHTHLLHHLLPEKQIMSMYARE